MGIKAWADNNKDILPEFPATHIYLRAQIMIMMKF